MPSLKPGQITKLPSVEITKSFLDKYKDDPKKLAKAKQLQDQINAYQKQIAELRKAIAKQGPEASKKLQNNMVNAVAAATSSEKQLRMLDLNPKITDKKLLNAVAFINKHCSEFLKECKMANRFLYRGVRQSEAIFLGRSKHNRETMDSDENLSKSFDELLKIGGFKALRSNSIFATSSFTLANSYGPVFAVFPVNGFNFTWSGVERDLIISPDHKIANLLSSDTYISKKNTPILAQAFNYINNLLDRSDISNFPESLLVILEHFPYESYDSDTVNQWLKQWSKFVNYIQKRHKTLRPEVSKKLNYNKVNAITKQLKMINVQAKTKETKLQQAQQLIKTLKLDQTNLVAAMKSEHEIYIHGTYVTIPAPYHGETIRLLTRYFLK
jgi:hypothetical protein